VTELRWLASPDDVREELRAALTVVWRDVANSGGAVGFAQQLPATEEIVRPALEETVATLGLARLLVAERDGAVAGWLLLTGNAGPVRRHEARVSRVMTSVAARGTGVARELLTELVRCARGELGLDWLRLEVRGGEGLEAFYERFGWRVTGSWPGALQITPDDRRDEVLMSLALR
jgi:GNAT superfamily N-acetyltransferase